MSLKRRNIIAWILLILCSVAWVAGQRMLGNFAGNAATATTSPGAIQETKYPPDTTAPSPEFTTPVQGETIPGTEASAGQIGTVSPTSGGSEPGVFPSSGQKAAGFSLSFAGAALAIAAIFLLGQQAPALGPDGIALLPGLLGWGYVAAFQSGFGVMDTFFAFLFTLSVLLSLRELWGWIRAKCRLSWCLVRRLAARCPTPQLTLMVYVGWIIAALIGVAAFFGEYSRYLPYAAPMAGMFLCAVFGICCLWAYGGEIGHLQRQLDHFRDGQPITVKEGSFSQAEAGLLEAQARQEEAIRTAVTSERFKVELIANVSHDLRTPLTSILGYGELLQKEQLSPEGQQQLSRLNQKAGYMRDLVESLFELTKVSSGVVPGKRERLDLIRLLEQTIGLFDDQLAQTGLVVRRNYAADAFPLITDGARLHQVFANLLGNAIKYAMPGTRIYLEVKETEDTLRVRMVNTASYEMDFQPEEIIQRFARGDKARSTRGSGLGLAIAQTYTESVGGSFAVTVDGDQFSAIVTLPKSERNL